MKYFVYTIHDTKAVTYNQPFFALNHAVAKRLVSDVVSDVNTPFGRHPADYRVYCIGQFDDQLGRFEQYDMLEHVVDCVALIPAQQAAFDFSPKANGAASEHGAE